MTVAETSLEAFTKKKENGTLTGDRKKVYQKIKSEGPISCKKVALQLNKFPNEISGRFTELLEQDMIKITGRKQGHRQYEVQEV